jgi:hypothetical protein
VNRHDTAPAQKVGNSSRPEAAPAVGAPIKFLWCPPAEGSWASEHGTQWTRLEVVKQTPSYTYFQVPEDWPLFYRQHSPLRVRTAKLLRLGCAPTLGLPGGAVCGTTVWLAPAEVPQ